MFVAFVVFSFCSALAVVSYAASFELVLKANDKIKLWPTTAEGRMQTSWNISADKGAKIIAECFLLSRSCNEYNLTINTENGSSVHCGNESHVLKFASDKMEISIKTSGYRKGVYCEVKATKSYLNQIYEERDSSEDGQKEGSKKTSCKCGWTNKNNLKYLIVGGSEASPNEYPWAVLLGERITDFQFCGGSIIAPKYVLTAAHCTYSKSVPLAVYVGEHDTRTTTKNPHAQKINVAVVHDYPSFNHRTIVGDISVLELVRPITFTQQVGPVCLPNPQEMPNIHDEFIKVMGWGSTKTNGAVSPVLKKVDLRVIDLEICSAFYSEVDTINQTQICTWAPNRDSCQGDSGGPLVWNDPKTNRMVQVAIVSYGRDCASTDPGVNTNVYSYMDWIDDIIKAFVVFGFCSALAVVSYAASFERVLKANDKIKLWPTTAEGRMQTSWNISADKGAKIIAECFLLSRSCNEYNLTINTENGSSVHCGNESHVLKFASDKMEISIKTSGYRKGVYCEVKATKSYLNQISEERDSSEDGQKEGSKKPSCKCGWTNKNNLKYLIVGGSEASPNEYPWAVLLGERITDFQFCGGSIIAPKYVLTAAHCTDSKKSVPLAVYVGEHDTRTTTKNPHAQKINVAVVHDYPSFNHRTIVGDISVLELVRPITFTQQVGPVCLPNPQEMPNIHDEFIKVMGWGLTKTNGTVSPVLKKVDLRVIDLEICSAFYAEVDTINATQICTWAPNRGSCQGDSGGPLVWNDPKTNRMVQVALVSYGSVDCASIVPGVSTNVYSYMDWIDDIIKGTSSIDDTSFCTI